MRETIRFDVVANARLNIPERRNRAGIERLDLGIIHALSIQRGAALALEPELVDIAPIPSLSVPVQTVALVRHLGLELVEEDVEALLVSAFRKNVPASVRHCILAVDGVGLIPGRGLICVFRERAAGRVEREAEEERGCQIRFHHDFPSPWFMP